MKPEAEGRLDLPPRSARACPAMSSSLAAVTPLVARRAEQHCAPPPPHAAIAPSTRLDTPCTGRSRGDDAKPEPAPASTADAKSNSGDHEFGCRTRVRSSFGSLDRAR